MATSGQGSSKSVSSKSLEPLLQCSVCFEQFDSTMRSPRQLQCHHTFCLQCLTSIAKIDQNGGLRQITLTCPTCRQWHNFSQGGIQQIPTDHKIVHLMDVLSVAEKESDNICEKHRQHNLNFFCKTCEVPVCRDCTVVSHKETKGHEVVEISEALKEFSSQFLNTKERAKQISEKLQDRSNKSNKTLQQLTENEAKIESQIRKAFDGYRAQLDETEKALFSQLRGYVSRDKEEIENLQEVLHHEVSTHRKLNEQFEEAEKQQDIRKLFDLMHQMKKWEASFTDLANDKEWRKWYEYSPHNEDTFRKELSQLGNIDKKSYLQQEIVSKTDSAAAGSDNASPRRVPVEAPPKSQKKKSSRLRRSTRAESREMSREERLEQEIMEVYYDRIVIHDPDDSRLNHTRAKRERAERERESSERFLQLQKIYDLAI